MSEKIYGVVVRAKDNFFFIEREDGSAEDVFGHINDCVEYNMPKKGDRLEFTIGHNSRGKCAKEIKNLSYQKENTILGSKLAEIEGKIQYNKHAKNKQVGITKHETLEEGKVLPFASAKNEPNIGLEEHHFYTVFNPMLNDISEECESYRGETQAHSFYNLLGQKGGHLYWGKLKSSSGNRDLNIEYFQQAVQANTIKGLSTILYISDFHYLWAAKVESVCKVLNKASEASNTLGFYKKHWDQIELWFKVVDMELASNDGIETNRLIGQFYIPKGSRVNPMQQPDKELRITPYTSNLRYPLIIKNQGYEDFFAKIGKRNVDSENPLLENDGSKKVSRTVCSYVIPKPIFEKMPLVIKNEIIMAETKYIESRSKSNVDRFHFDKAIASDYLRILEASIRDLVFEKFYSKVAHRDFTIDKNGKLQPFGGGPSKESALKTFSLGSLAKLMNFNLFKLKNEKPELYHVLERMNSILLNQELKDVRDSKVHLNHNEKCASELEDIRRLILGVGHKGFLNELYYAFYKEEVKAKIPMNDVA